MKASSYQKEVGTGNVKVHLDTFHMICEDLSSMEAVVVAVPLTIESFNPGFVELNRLCCIWRKFADTGGIGIKELKGN